MTMTGLDTLLRQKYLLHSISDLSFIKVRILEHLQSLEFCIDLKEEKIEGYEES